LIGNSGEIFHHLTLHLDDVKFDEMEERKFFQKTFSSFSFLLFDKMKFYKNFFSFCASIWDLNEEKENKIWDAIENYA
jgi:hypothetical protein